MNIIGFFALIYGVFMLDNYGLSLDGVTAVVAGLALMLHKEIFSYIKRHHYGK